MSLQRYYFNLTDGTQVLSDGNGLPLQSIAQARARALNCGTEILDEIGAVVEVRNTNGALVFAAPLSVRGPSESRRALRRDALTDLPLRPEFLEKLGEAFFEACSYRLPIVAVMSFDVDALKDINDAYGYAAGDAVLRDIGESLTTLATKHGHIVARLDGDKFAIACPGLSSSADVADWAERVRDTLSRPIHFAKTLISHSGSCGVSIFPDNGHDAAELSKCADIALHQGKITGSRAMAFYSNAMKIDQTRRRKMLDDAQAALTEGRIVPFYQPKISTQDNSICGFEALLRVNSSYGPLPPITISAALDHPIIGLEIGRAIQSQVLMDMNSWLEAKLEFGSVAINASTIELTNSEYTKNLIAKLELNNLSNDMIQVEVTETCLSVGNSNSKVKEELRDLMAQGVDVYLDDFGTGYGSLKHLLELPIRGLKIDRSFVDRIGSPQSRAIIGAIMSMATGLGLSVVGEGVETEQQAEYLRSEGCSVLQGYLYGKAMAADEVANFLHGLHRRQLRHESV